MDTSGQVEVSSHEPSSAHTYVALAPADEGNTSSKCQLFLGINGSVSDNATKVICNGTLYFIYGDCAHKVEKGVSGGIFCIETMADSCRTYEFVISFVLIGITCCFGFIGNSLALKTLQCDSVKSVTTFLLMSLAVADMAFLVPAVFVIMIPSYCEYFQTCGHNLSANILPYLEQYGWAVASMMHTCTVYVTVLVGIHRYVWVCRPHSSRRWSGMNVARAQVTIVPIAALVFNSPRFLEYRVQRVTDSNGVTTETIKVLTDLGETFGFQIIYKTVFFFLLMYVIPLTILIYVSFHLIMTLRKRRSTMQMLGHRSSTQRRDDNITFVLIIINVVFIICQTPTLVQRLTLAVTRTEGHICGEFYFYLEQVADYMAILNSCINFVIYVLFARQFRHTLFHEVLCVPKTSRHQSEDRDRFVLVRQPPSNVSRDVGENAPIISRTKLQGNGLLAPPINARHAGDTSSENTEELINGLSDGTFYVRDERLHEGDKEEESKVPLQIDVHHHHGTYKNSMATDD